MRIPRIWIRLFGRENTREQGQSLVEMALFAPIFIVILAGLVEVGQYTVTQNRLSTASRSAARFAANGGENEGMVIVAHNAITKTAQISTDPDLWDMWVIRATVDNTAGNSFVDWEPEHLFGNKITGRYEAINAQLGEDGDIQREILDDLKAEGRDVRELRIVASLIVYDASSFLGINQLWDTPYSMRSLNILRITGLDLEQTNGCAAYPIAVRQDSRSANTLPPSGYIKPAGYQLSPGDFPIHEGGRSLEESREGYVYVWNNSDITWLAWNQFRPDVTHVAESLAWPGNSQDYSIGNPNQRGYAKPTDLEDRSLHIGDMVRTASPATINEPSIETQIGNFVDRGNHIRVIVWDEQFAGDVRISAFAVFRVHGYGPGWITAEFIRVDNSCGQVLPEG